MSVPRWLLSDPLTGSGWDSSGSDKLIRRAIQQRLGAQLRRLYADLVEEPVPERFLKLVSRCDGKDRETS